MRTVGFIMLFVVSFAARSQKSFNFSDTVFTFGQKHALRQIRYALGDHNQLIADSLSLIELDSVVQFLEKNN